MDDVLDRHTEPLWAAAALVTIDLQRDTLDDQPFAVGGTAQAAQRASALCAAFRSVRRPIVHVVRLYRPGGEDADRVRRAALETGPAFLAGGTPGAELAPGVAPAGTKLDTDLLLTGAPQQAGPAEYIVFKPRWGAFYRTPLGDLLQSHAVTTVVFAGCNFPNCPRASIVEASERDFRVVLAGDATSRVRDDHVGELRDIGVLVTSVDDIIGQLVSRTSVTDAAHA